MNEAETALPRTHREIKLTPVQETRFWAKVNKNGPTMPHMESACWVYTGGKYSFGYGMFHSYKETFLTHRVAWTLANGAVPRGICVCHKCDNPACCRPDHLFLGTNADNVRDRVSKGRNGFAAGDANGSRSHPERLTRGDNHPARLHPERMARGESHGRALITAAQVLEIRRLYSSGGITQSALGNQFSVTRSAVGRILRRKIWRHI